MLANENHNIDKLLHHGQIEEKDAAQLKEEIEKKLYYLETNAPKINFDFNPQRIISYSDLSVIFTRDQLIEYT